jgi:transposase-like protein
MAFVNTKVMNDCVHEVDREHFRRDEHRKCESSVEERGRGTKPPKRYRTVEEKQRIIEEALLPGESIARVERAHDGNANQVFGWRQLSKAGVLILEFSHVSQVELGHSPPRRLNP